MKFEICRKAFILAVVSFLAFGLEAVAQQQKEDGPDIYEQAEAEAYRLQGVLKLEDWQTFYVDSILKHDYSAMLAEYEQYQKAKVSNPSIYQSVQDKWKDKMDEAFRKVFNDEQWAKYLKNGAGKAQKGREKRKAKAEGKK